MAGESQLHKTLKREACRWLFATGYSAVAAEVPLRPLGIIDAVGTGVFGSGENFLGVRRNVRQVAFVECKASRSDFLRDRDADGVLTLALFERSANTRRVGRKPLRPGVGLGKFRGCLANPLAHLHYLLTPAGLIRKHELPPRWGWLTLCDSGIVVVQRPLWQEAARGEYVDSAIARTLTASIHRADQRALQSVNRQLMAHQESLARRILDAGRRMLET